MHAYRDAIRRSARAYILYPGNSSQECRGFHEILPGIGAFTINPSKNNRGLEDLKVFLGDVVEHFLNRVSQREKMAYRTYEIYKNNKPDTLKEPLPECVGRNRGFFADETTVLVGFYKHQKHLKWILDNSFYNVRVGLQKGSLKFNTSLLQAKYLLLHTTNELHSSRLYKIVSDNTKLFSLSDLISLGYPESEKLSKTESFYLVFCVEEIKELGLMGEIWDVSKLVAWRKGHASALPFTVLLSELVKVKL